jgi:ribosomal protein L9
MQKKVKVLLLKPLINKGNAGDVVEVKLHFAQQVLVPQETAVIYDKQAQNQHEAHMKKVSAHKAELVSKVKAMLETLSQEGVTFEKQATDNETLYDSITERSLAQYLMHTYAINLTAQNIVLEEKIEQLGTYTAQFIYENIKGSFGITVVKK